MIFEFHKNYPGINFHIVDEDTQKIVELLNSGIIDVGIVRPPINKEIFDYIPLLDDHMIAVSTETYLDNNQKQISLMDLRDKPLIVQRRYEKRIVNLCNEAGFEPRIICISNDSRTILLWASLKIGIAILPSVCRSLITNGNLSYKDIDEPSLKIGSAVIWLKKRYLSSASKYFLEIVRSYLEKEKD